MSVKTELFEIFDKLPSHKKEAVLRFVKNLNNENSTKQSTPAIEVIDSLQKLFDKKDGAEFENAIKDCEKIDK